MSEVGSRETAWFAMKPDCYGGPECDQIEPRWHCYAEGDKDSDDQREPLSLDPKVFPPGTRIVVIEPTCPCGMPRGVIFPVTDGGKSEPKFEAKCDECGFDWEAWTLNEYS